MQALIGRLQSIVHLLVIGVIDPLASGCFGRAEKPWRKRTRAGVAALQIDQVPKEKDPRL